MANGFQVNKQAKIPVAMFYGYTVFTTLCWPLPDELLTLHLQRLRHDANFMGIPLPHSDHDIRQMLVTQFSEPTVARLTVIPGINCFSELIRPPQDSHIEISSRPLPQGNKMPMRLKSVIYEKRFPTIKHGALAEALLLKRQAVQQGEDDVVWVNRQGRISEATTANVFFIRNQTLLTPEPIRDGCLPGTTRHQILQWADKQNVVIKDQALSLEETSKMDGMFLTNAVFGLREVGRLDDIHFPWPDSAKALTRQIAKAIASPLLTP